MRLWWSSSFCVHQYIHSTLNKQTLEALLQQLLLHVNILIGGGGGLKHCYRVSAVYM